MLASVCVLLIKIVTCGASLATPAQNFARFTEKRFVCLAVHVCMLGGPCQTSKEGWHERSGKVCGNLLDICYAQVPGTISPGPFQQFNCIINTVVSLLGATVITFIASAFVGGKFDMVWRLHRPICKHTPQYNLTVNPPRSQLLIL